MTKKEIDIQIALGTIQPQDLSSDEFDYWAKITTERIARNMAEFDKIRQAAGQILRENE